MEVHIPKSEPVAVSLIRDLLKLNEIHAYRARCEEEMQRLGLADVPNVAEFRRLKRNFLRQIY